MRRDTELSSILRRFYAEFKTNQKKDLTPSALTGIRAVTVRSSSIPGDEVNVSLSSSSETRSVQAI